MQMGGYIFSTQQPLVCTVHMMRDIMASITTTVIYHVRYIQASTQQNLAPVENFFKNHEFLMIIPV